LDYQGSFVMLKRYRNHLLKMIQEKGIDPRLFKAEDLGSTKAIAPFMITLKESLLMFMIENPENDFHCFRWRFTEFNPRFTVTERIPTGWVQPDGLYNAFKYWLEDHVKPYLYEQVEPDLWERIALQEPLLTGSALISEDTEYFTDDEKFRLRMSIETFRLSVVNTFQPSDDQLKVIDGHLKYLKDAVDRLNRIDWRGVAIMTLIQISIVLTLDTEKGRLLLSLFEQVFSGVLKLIQ